MKKYYSLSLINVLVVCLLAFVSYFHITSKIQYIFKFYEYTISFATLVPVTLAIAFVFGIGLFVFNSIVLKLLSKNVNLGESRFHNRLFWTGICLFIFYVLLIIVVYFEFMFKAGTPRF